MNELEVVVALLSLGADIEQEGEHGYTPLQEAISQENYKTTLFLLMNGVDFKKTIDNESSALELFGFTLKNVKIID
jgi:ankyrin repeat protein